MNFISLLAGLHTTAEANVYSESTITSHAQASRVETLSSSSSDKLGKNLIPTFSTGSGKMSFIPSPQVHSATSVHVDNTTIPNSPLPSKTSQTHSKTSSYGQTSGSVEMKKERNSTAFILYGVTGTGEIQPTTTAPTQFLSSSSHKITPSLKSSDFVNSLSIVLLQSISQTENVVGPLNTGQKITEVNTSYFLPSATPRATTRLSTFQIQTDSDKYASTQVILIMSVTTTVQPSKSTITPALQSSVWIPPYYRSWGNWSTCSRDCGGGYTYRIRNCSYPGQCEIFGPSRNTTICNLRKCNGMLVEIIIEVEFRTCHLLRILSANKQSLKA